MKKQFLEAGKIVNTHGIRGEVRVQSWCDTLEMLAQFDILYFDCGRQAVEIEEARAHKNIVIMKIKGTNNLNDAEKLRGKVLYLDRNDLELDKDTFFIQDLIGCRVADFDDHNMIYGDVLDITETGANDVYHIRTLEGQTVLIPGIPDVIREISLEDGIVYITPLEGLFDDED